VESRGLLLIEDAAHAAGAEQAGTFGDAAAFSFYGNKNMTTAEGGVVTGFDAGVLTNMRQMRSHGMTSSTFQRFSSRTVGYDVTMLGFNYRMDDLRAAIGLVQLQKLAGWNDKRKALTHFYVKLLQDRCPEITVPFADCLESSQQSSSHHIMPVVLPERSDRQAVIARLRELGIQTSNHYPAVHQLSFYSSRFPSVYVPHTELFAQRELTLPLHPRMNEPDVEHVVDALTAALASPRELLNDFRPGARAGQLAHQ
jgi:dTDP-4-amino-4,6-dideoxygalactose transaminase